MESLLLLFFFENFKKIRELNFNESEKFETVYEYHEHYYLKLFYDDSKNGINQYNEKGDLIATYYIENEKKTYAEFFSPTCFSTEKYDGYGNTIEWYTENKITNTIETIRQEIVYQ